MKRVILFGFLFSLITVLSVFADPIRSFEEFKNAMQEGKRFVILLDISQCSNNSIGHKGYFAPTSIMYVPETERLPERILTSHLHFSDHTGAPSYEYVKYTFFADNSATIRTAFYEPGTFLQKNAAYTVQCAIGKGIEIHASSPVP